MLFARISTRTSLILTKLALAAIFIAMPVVGRRNAFWPVVNWGMYSRKPLPYPKPSASAFCLRVMDATGRVNIVWAQDLWGVDRFHIAGRSFDRSFALDEGQREAHRRFLVHLLDEARPTPSVQRIESVQMSWTVDALAVPPFDRDRPNHERPLGEFEAEPYRRQRGGFLWD